MQKEHLRLIEELTHQLTLKQLKITTAESCTGGLLASYLTDLSGSSNWFERGFVTYSNQSKVELLGVDSQLIQSQGAVSQAVAESMARGALNHSKADLALAVTGIAGPGGGTPNKPVGTVWFAFTMRNKLLHSTRHYFPHLSRKEIREQACLEALKGALTFLNS